MKIVQKKGIANLAFTIGENTEDIYHSEEQ